jgi:hypothetical protein
MGLSYCYEFSAPADATPEALEAFLRGVERLARVLRFSPTTVLNVRFDTPERREFSRRLGGSVIAQDERLKGLALPSPEQVSDHDRFLGECRLIPEHGVVLVVTDEAGCEVCFGFFRYPQQVLDIHGRILAVGAGADWWFRDFLDSSDPRYRQIVEHFRVAGYLRGVTDEYL